MRPRAHAVVWKSPASLAGMAWYGQCRVVSRLTIVDHGFESWLGFHRQYDYECNSTGTDIAIALLYFRMAIKFLVYPDMQFAMALTLIIAS